MQDYAERETRKIFAAHFAKKFDTALESFSDPTYMRVDKAIHSGIEEVCNKYFQKNDSKRILLKNSVERFFIETEIATEQYIRQLYVMPWFENEAFAMKKYDLLARMLELLQFPIPQTIKNYKEDYFMLTRMRDTLVTHTKTLVEKNLSLDDKTLELFIKKGFGEKANFVRSHKLYIRSETMDFETTLADDSSILDICVLRAFSMYITEVYKPIDIVADELFRDKSPEFIA